MKKMLSAALCALILLSIHTSASAQTKAEADKWFAAREYLGGLKLVPSATINTVEFAKQYKLNKAEWDKAFAYLKNTDLDKLPVGKYPIDGDVVFASVTDNPTKPYDQTVWESHRKYIDLQYVITGSEKMGEAPVASAEVTDPYSDAKDVAHYKVDGTQYEATQGTFFIFFPTDAHRVNIKVDGVEHDKKIVIKIKVVE